MAEITYTDEIFLLDKDFVAQKLRPILDTWGWKFYGNHYGKADIKLARVQDFAGAEVPAAVVLNLIEDLDGADTPGDECWVPDIQWVYDEAFLAENPDSWTEEAVLPGTEEARKVHGPPPTEATGAPLGDFVGNLMRDHWFKIFEAEQAAKSASNGPAPGAKRPWEKPKIRQVKPEPGEAWPGHIMQERPGGMWEKLGKAVSSNPLKLPGFEITVDLDDPFGHFATASGRIDKWGFLDLHAGDKKIRIKFELDHALDVAREAANLVVDQAGRQGLQDIAKLIKDPEKARELIPVFLAMYETMGGKTPERLTKAMETLRRIFSEPAPAHESAPIPGPELHAVRCPRCGSVGMPDAMTQQGLKMDRTYFCQNPACDVMAYGVDGVKSSHHSEPAGDESAEKTGIQFCPECHAPGELTVGTREGEVVYNCRSEQCRVLNFSGSDSGCTIRINPDFLPRVPPSTTGRYCIGCGQECRLHGPGGVYRCDNPDCHIGTFDNLGTLTRKDDKDFCPVCGEPAVSFSPGIPKRGIPPSYTCENISCYVATFDQAAILTRKVKDPRVCPECGTIGTTINAGSPGGLQIVFRCERADCPVQFFNIFGVLLERPPGMDEAEVETEEASPCPECGEASPVICKEDGIAIYECPSAACMVLHFSERGLESWFGQGRYGKQCPRCLGRPVLVGPANNPGAPKICMCPHPGCDVFLYDQESGRIIRVKEKQEDPKDGTEEQAKGKEGQGTDNG